jgi:putative ABC transport system substrate-binding protein
MTIDIGRRQFISALGGAAAAWPLAARAQQPQQRRLGLLLAYTEDDSIGQQFVTAFVQGLRDLGWTDGGNIHIDYRWCGSNVDRIRRAASELLELKPDAILAHSTLTLQPLQQMTTTVPLVFVQVADPVGSGFITSMANPGGNITGFALAEFATSNKMLEVLKELVPQVKRVVVIYNPVQAPNVGMWRAIEAAAPSLSVHVSAVSAVDADNLTHVIEAFAHEPDSGMIVLPNPIAIANRKLIIELTTRYRLPVVYTYAYFVREGGLASYGSDPAVQYRQAASYVDHILKGAKPADLPVQLATSFNLAVNLRTAKAIGLTIPESFLIRADEVIE